MVHGCVIEDQCLIGMNATALNGVVVGAGSLVAAGAVVREGMVIPPRSLVAGVPAKVLRDLTDTEHGRVVAWRLAQQGCVPQGEARPQTVVGHGLRDGTCVQSGPRSTRL